MTLKIAAENDPFTNYRAQMEKNDIEYFMVFTKTPFISIQIISLFGQYIYCIIIGTEM